MDLKNHYEKESLIDFKEICWRLLEQWKAVLLVTCCITLAFLGYVYLHNAKESRSQNQAQQEKQYASEQEIIDALPDTEQELVASAYRLLQKREEYSRYIVSAPIMEIDPNHAKRIRINWAVESDKQNKDTLVMAYVLGLQSESCKSALIEGSGASIDSEEFNDLISITLPNQADGGVVCCDVFLTEDMDTEAIQEALRSQVQELHDKLSEELGDHNIKNYQSEVGVVSDQTIYSRQVSVLSNYSTINNQINILKNTFSAAQDKAFTKLQEKDHTIETTNQAPAPKKTFTKLNILIGLILGLCAYVILFFIYVALSNRAISSNMLNESNIRLLGEWYGDTGSKKTGLKRDQFVWIKHHRKHLDREQEIESTSNVIDNICQFNQMSKVLFAMTAECSKIQSTFINALSDSLALKNITVKTVDVKLENNARSDSALMGADGVVLIIVDSKTRSKDVGAVFDRCNDYNKPLLGSVYLG